MTTPLMVGQQVESDREIYEIAQAGLQQVRLHLENSEAPIPEYRLLSLVKSLEKLQRICKLALGDDAPPTIQAKVQESIDWEERLQNLVDSARLDKMRTKVE